MPYDTIDSFRGVGKNRYPRPPSVTASSLSANGYVTLAGGLIIQWGEQQSNVAVTFPIPFPTALSSLTTDTNWNGSATSCTVVNTSNRTNTGFVAEAYRVDNGLSPNVVEFLSGGWTFRWIAIGY